MIMIDKIELTSNRILIKDRDQGGYEVISWSRSIETYIGLGDLSIENGDVVILNTSSVPIGWGKNQSYHIIKVDWVDGVIK